MKKWNSTAIARQKAQISRALACKRRLGKRYRPSEADPLIRLLSLNRMRVTFYKQLAFEPEFIESSLQSISKIRSFAEAGHKIFLDFSLTTRVQASAVTYLSAEIDVLKAIYGTRFAYCPVGVSAAINELLEEVGLLNRIKGIGGVPPRKLCEDLVPVTMGVDKDHLDVILRFILGNALKRGNLQSTDRAKAENLAYKALSEAMLNVKQHAYPLEQPVKPWWVTASILENVIYIAFCDRGLGMPATIPKSFGEQILSFGSLLNRDADLIQAIMHHTRSSVADRGGRGYGTKDIQQLVRDPEFCGKLTVVSGAGFYSLDLTEDCSSPNETGLNLSTQLKGTALLWIIPIQR